MNPHADGRDTRWTEHRVLRRNELVESTLRAIRHRGATVSIDEIAAEAGTSKPVFYRHFGDRPGLYRAVVEKVAQFILDDLRATVGWERTDDLPPWSETWRTATCGWCSATRKFARWPTRT